MGGGVLVGVLVSVGVGVIAEPKSWPGLQAASMSRSGRRKREVFIFRVSNLCNTILADKDIVSKVIMDNIHMYY